MKLTDLAIKKSPLTTAGQKTYRDDSLPGFGVRCSTRSKSFVVMFGSDRQLRTVGKYPDISLANARREAMVLLADRPSKKKIYGFHDVREEYFRDCFTRVRPNTLKEYRRHLIKLDDVKIDKINCCAAQSVPSWG